MSCFPHAAERKCGRFRNFELHYSPVCSKCIFAGGGGGGGQELIICSPKTTTRHSGKIFSYTSLRSLMSDSSIKKWSFIVHSIRQVTTKLKLCTIQGGCESLTSVNSISSMPSPVYQWRKALRLNMAVNCSLILLNSSWILVLLPINVADILSPRGGMSHAAVFTLFGIHSTKYVLKNKRKTAQIKIFLLQRTSEGAIIRQPGTTRFINSLHLTLQIIYLFLF